MVENWSYMGNSIIGGRGRNKVVPRTLERETLPECPIIGQGDTITQLAMAACNIGGEFNTPVAKKVVARCGECSLAMCVKPYVRAKIATINTRLNTD